MSTKKQIRELRQEIEGLEAQINDLQKTTKTFFAQFSRPHNLLRVKFPWYHRWHARPWNSRFHVTLLVLFVVLNVLIVANVIAYMPSEQAKAITRPIYGVSSSLGSVDSATREKALTMIQSAGSNWVRAGAYWPWTDRNGKAGRDWSVTDNFVNDAKRHNQAIVGSIAGYASWANGGAGDWYAASDPTEFANFVRDTVTRYKADVHYWEIWNEPNLKEFWTAEDPYTNTAAAAAHYTKLLRASYLAVKQADPTAKVIYGGLSRNDFGYLNKSYDAIKKYPDAAANNNFFDILSVHPYCDDRSPESTDPAHVWSNMDRNFSGLPKMKAAMEVQGDTAKHIIVTEFGWVVTDISWTKGVGQALQADYLKRAYAMAQNWPWLDAMMWYGFKDWNNEEGPYSLVNTDLTPRLSYNAFKESALPVVSDTTPPTLSITSPLNNSTVSSSITITANASDNVGVTKVDFSVDGNYLATDSVSPYSYSWDSKTKSNGQHTLSVKAFDAVGLSSSSQITVNVNNVTASNDLSQPTVSITNPANGTVLGAGTLRIVADAKDDIAIASVEFYIDGRLAHTEYGAPYEYGWRIRKNMKGNHTISVKAFDTSGKNASAQISIIVR